MEDALQEAVRAKKVAEAQAESATSEIETTTRASTKVISGEDIC